MVVTLVVFAITYLFIATEKIDKSIAAIAGASVLVILHQAPYEFLLQTVDLNVIFLLTGMMVIVSILSETGVFEWVAITIAQQSKGVGLIIVLKFLLATAIFSALLDNVTTVILIAPITILVCQILEIPAILVLILEAIFSNIGGTSTLVGDPPNIVIGSGAGLSFMDFVINLAPPVAVIIVVCVAITIVLFRKRFYVPDDIRIRVMKAHPEKAIIEPLMLKRALPVFGLVLVGFFAGHAFHVEPGIIALAGALIMCAVCRQDVHHVFAKVEWATIFFFIGLFMIIGTLEHVHLFEHLGEMVLKFSGGDIMITCIAVLWFCAIFSAIVDNIPLVIAMMPLIKSIIPEFAAASGITDPALISAQISQPLYWSLALGACLGGNGSLIGASANVMVAQIARSNKYDLSFWKFAKYGFPLMIISLLVSTIYVYLRYF